MLAALMGLPGKMKKLLDRVTNATEPLDDTRVANLDNLTAPVAPASTALSSAVWTSGKAAFLDAAVSTSGKKPKTQVFTASGTWTRPTGVDAVLVLAVGGGGGSASCYNPSWSEGSFGGCGGRVFHGWLPVTGNVSVTVGAGGAGGAAGANNNGVNGGDTTLTAGATLTCPGGRGSTGRAGLNVVTDAFLCAGGGGNGGVNASNGGSYDTANIPDSAWSAASAWAGTANQGGPGVNGLGGGGGAWPSGKGVDGGGDYNAAATANTGGGGGGITCAPAGNVAGKAGADGIVYITWWE